VSQIPGAGLPNHEQPDPRRPARIGSRIAARVNWGSIPVLDRAAGILIAALATLTVVMLVTPNVAGHFPAPGLDLVLDTVAALVTATAGALAATRFRESGEPIALVHATALSILAIGNAIAVVTGLAGQGALGSEIARTGNTQLFVFTATRLYAAGLLVAGGSWILAGRVVRHPLRLFLAHIVATMAILALVEWAADSLPALIRLTVTGTGVEARGDASATLLGVVLQAGGASLTMVASVLSRRMWLRDRNAGDGYIALGLVAASFAQLHELLFPSIHPIQVSSGDVLWLVFALALFLAITALAQGTLSALRIANEQLVQLREADIDRAAFEERARLSRELHDGLAQDLWLAKLKVSRLLAVPGLGPEATGLGVEVESTIDAGLADARQAVMALRYMGDEDGTLADLIRRFVEDFSDRYGLRVDYDADPDLPRLSSRAEAELLRITQESLSNVRRHADATVVRVSLRTNGGQLVLLVRDNGRGFDPNAVKDGSFGLAAMGERAAIARGRLQITSEPGAGTSVQLTIALPGDVVG